MAKKIYNVEWEYVRRGRSQHEFNDLEELIGEHTHGAGLIDDYGNSDEFDESYNVESGWKIISIEEVK